MKSKLIAIAIGLALILGIVLIGGIRITRANELSNKVLASRVLRLSQVQGVKLEPQQNLVSHDLGNRRRTLSSTLDRNVLNAVELSDHLLDTREVVHNLNVGLLVEVV